MALLADAKATLFDKEFSRRDQLPMAALAIGVSGVCVAMCFGIGAEALNAVTGLSGALLGLFGVKFGILDKKRFEKALEKLEEKDA